MKHTTNVPKVDFETRLVDGLDVETLCGLDELDVLVGQTLQDSSLTSIVLTKEKKKREGNQQSPVK
jgi:hypothetical protein